MMNHQIGITGHQLSIEEQTRKTILHKIQQILSYWRLTKLIVRFYHDALIEYVCACQQIYRFKAINDYLNACMHQRYEK